MARNGSGTYVLPTGNPVITHTLITSTWANTTMTDLANALTQSISKDGQTVPTQNLPMGGLAHTGVAAAIQFDQYARADQVQDGTFLRFTATSMPSQDVYTANLIFGITSFVPNQLIVGAFPTNNVSTATLNINGSGAAAVVREDGTVLQADDIVAGQPAVLLWDGMAWRLLGAAGTNGVVSFNSRVGAITLLSADVTAALAYTPVNVAGDTMTGTLTAPNVSVTTKVTAKQVQLTADTTLATTVDFSTGQSKVFTMSGALAITSITGLTTGNMGRMTFLNTSAGALTFPASVKWPQPSELPPTFTGGSLKKVIVSLQYDGSVYLANASVY